MWYDDLCIIIYKPPILYFIIIIYNKIRYDKFRITIYNKIPILYFIIITYKKTRYDKFCIIIYKEKLNIIFYYYYI